MVELGFNYGIYPPIIYFFGLAWGSVIMLFLSFLACWGTILLYDYLGEDWLGIESVKSVRDSVDSGPGLKGKISQLLKKSKVLFLLFLSIKFDAFIAVIYLREGANKFDGMTKQDWKHFWISLFISNIYWSIVVFTGLSIFQWMYKWVT